MYQNRLPIKQEHTDFKSEFNVKGALYNPSENDFDNIGHIMEDELVIKEELDDSDVTFNEIEYEERPTKVVIGSGRKQQQIFFCRECEFRTKYASSFQNHMQYYHKQLHREFRKQFKLLAPQFKIATQFKIPPQFKIAHNKKSVVLYCTECNYHTRSEHYIQLHKEEHRNNLYCDKCNYQTNNSLKLSIHKLRHQDCKF